MTVRAITISLMILLSSAVSYAQSVPRSCESLQGLKLPDTTITYAQTVAAGDFTLPAGAPPPVLPGVSYKTLPTFCRVTGVIKPTSDSDIRFEVWLPSANWNQKFHGIGNGGFAGMIDYGVPGLTGLTGALSRGSAAAATDTGHQGKGEDASWALGHPEKVIDYGHRAHWLAVRLPAGRSLQRNR